MIYHAATSEVKHNLDNDSLQNKCRTANPDQQNLGRSGKLSFFTISVAYRYRKSISIIELFVSIILIYIEFSATNF